MQERTGLSSLLKKSRFIQLSAVVPLASTPVNAMAMFLSK